MRARSFYLICFANWVTNEPKRQKTNEFKNTFRLRHSNVFIHWRTFMLIAYGEAANEWHRRRARSTSINTFSVKTLKTFALDLYSFSLCLYFYLLNWCVCIKVARNRRRNDENEIDQCGCADDQRQMHIEIEYFFPFSNCYYNWEPQNDICDERGKGKWCAIGRCLFQNPIVPNVPVGHDWWCSTCGRQRAAYAHTHPFSSRDFFFFSFLFLARPYHSAESQTEICRVSWLVNHENRGAVVFCLICCALLVLIPFEICVQMIQWAPVIMNLKKRWMLFHSNYPFSRNRYSVVCMRSVRAADIVTIFGKFWYLGIFMSEGTWLILPYNA